MRYISLSVDRGRVDRQRKIWPDLEVFDGFSDCDPRYFREECIPESYRQAAAWFVAEGLGRETIFMQDDVWLPHGPGFDRWISQYDPVPLLILGQTEKGGGVAPKAFSATPQVWVELSKVWTGEGRIIPAWMPVVEEFGEVLNVCKGLGG